MYLGVEFEAGRQREGGCGAAELPWDPPPSMRAYALRLSDAYPLR